MAAHRKSVMNNGEIEVILEELSNESDVSYSDFEDSGSEYVLHESEEDTSSERSEEERLPTVGAHNIIDSDTSTDSEWEEIKIDGHDNPPQPPIHYAELPGMKHAPPPDSKPIIYFDLFFTLSLLRLIVTETNRYAQQYIHSHVNLSPSSRAKSWKTTSIEEIRALLACILNMGIIRKPTIFSYWSKTSSLSTPWFSSMFPRNRFQILLKFLHLVDNSKLSPPGHPSYDPCGKFQPMVDHANNVFRHYYTPHQQLSIDESLVGTKCHTQLQQYLPNKHHHRWGIKFWMVCDSVVNYCLGFYTYRGAKSAVDKDEIKKNGLAYTVVTKLLSVGNYLHKGYHVYCDNFFTSVPLAKHLYTVGTFITGTIRKNRKFLPLALLQKFNVGEFKFFISRFLLLSGFREKKSQRKQVLLLSTDSLASTSFSTPRNKPPMSKPDMILQYNKYMGGIDTSDMMLYHYLDERRTLIYWKKVTFNIISRMLLNCYILYKENLPAGQKAMSRLRFNCEVIHSLSTEWYEKRGRAGNVTAGNYVQVATVQYGVRTLPDRKLRLCKECSTGTCKIRSRTVVQQLFEKLDIDRDGRISFEEFLLLFRSGGSRPTHSPKNAGRLRAFQQRSGSSEEHQGLGSMAALDPNNTGLVSSDAILEAWEAAGVPKAASLLHSLGLADTQQLSVTELASVLEDELRGLAEERRGRVEDSGSRAIPCSPHETLLQATLALYQLEVRCLKSSLEHMSAERDKLRADIVDANERASLLAQEVDDHHARLEASSQLQVKLLEQRHAEQLRQVTEQLGSEREQLAVHSQALERQVAALQDEESRIRVGLATLQGENEALDKENQCLLEQLAESKRARAQLQEEVESMASLQQRLSELEGNREQEQVLPLLEKMNELQAENTGLRDRIDELTVEMEDLTVRLAATKLKKSALVQTTDNAALEEGGNGSSGGGGTKRRGDSPLALPQEESSEEESPRLGKVRRCCSRGAGGGDCREEPLDAVDMEGLQIHTLGRTASGLETDVKGEKAEDLFSEPGLQGKAPPPAARCKWNSIPAEAVACEEDGGRRELARLRLRVAELEHNLKLQTDKLLVCETERERLGLKQSEPALDSTRSGSKLFKGQLKQVFQLIRKQALQELLEDGELMSSLQRCYVSQRVTKLTSVMNGPLTEQHENAKDVEQLEQHCRDLKSQLEQVKVEIVKILSEKKACSKENCALKIHISDLKNRLPTEDSSSPFPVDVMSECIISESKLVDDRVFKSENGEGGVNGISVEVTKDCTNLLVVCNGEVDEDECEVDEEISFQGAESSILAVSEGRSLGSELQGSGIEGGASECSLNTVQRLQDEMQGLAMRLGEAEAGRETDESEEVQPSEVQRLQDEMRELAARLVKAEEVPRLRDEVRRLTTGLGEAEERCTELEASLELLRQEYEKCEDYWASKLEEERHLYDQEQRLSDEKYAELMTKIREYEEQCGGSRDGNDSDDSDDRLSTIEERASLEKQVTDLEEECEELRVRAELEQAEREEELQQLRERLRAAEQRLQLAGCQLDVAVQVSDLENGSWESDRTFVVELDGARKVCHRPKDTSRGSRSSTRLATGLSNGYSSCSSPDAAEVRRLQELKSQLDEECQALRQQKETLLHSTKALHNGVTFPELGSKAVGQACQVDLSVLQALNSRLRQQEQRCRHLQQMLKQQQRHTDSILRQTWQQHKEEVTDLKTVLTTTQDRLLQQTSACKEQMDRLANTDLLVKELYVENAYLVATVQRLEQRCHVLVQMTSDSTSV